ETVLAHVRKATQGGKTVFNCHPFQYGRWVFAHNGDIPNFVSKRDALLGLVNPKLRRYILGETDSEVLFFLFLSALAEQGSPSEQQDLSVVTGALRSAIGRVREVSDRDGTHALLTIMTTNGRCLLAAQGGKELFVSTYKTRCSDRGTCPSLSPACEAPVDNGP